MLIFGTRGQRAVAVGIGAMIWQGLVFGCNATVCLVCGIFTAAVWYLIPDATDDE